MQVLIKPLEWIMNACHGVCHNYGLAIILFTLISKLVLLPVSIWVQKNSIKMVKMQPELNDVKVKFFGDGERISEEEFKIYKKYHYSPFISVIPMAIQLLLLMGVIEVIKAGINAGNIDMSFLGFSLAVVPSEAGGWFFLSPFLAAASAWIMCACQNASNVLQAEQGKASQIFTMALSVGLSLYLGIFVSVGVAIYWIFSNLFSVVQLYLLNAAINPKKFVDYEALERSKKALAELEGLDKKRDRHDPKVKEYARREKEDYKRFFSIVNKHLVFYSESNGFYKYYAGLIEYLLEKTNLVIHYVTSDPEDSIFEKAKEQPKIKPYYIAEKKLITLMMKMDADMVVMTMPDLNNYHVKRSYVRNDIEYLYIPHCLDSLNMTMRKGSMDHFDSVLCAGRSQTEEITAIEKAYNLKPKRLIECGYFLLDDMLRNYEKMDHQKKPDEQKMILIAPSWQENNIVDSCLDELLEQLKTTGYHVIVRPHPQHVRHKKEKLEKLKERFAGNDLIEIQLDFSATDTVWKADLLITDWSGITYEYCYCTHRPVLFINTPMKVMNPEYQKIDVVPINIAVRETFGASVDPDKLDSVPKIVYNLIEGSERYEKVISDFVKGEVYNLGTSAQVGGKYIVNQLMERKKKP